MGGQGRDRLMEFDERALLRAMYRISVDTSLEFIKTRTGEGPLFVVMARARADAMQALAGLVQVDPARTEDIRKLQNEVQRFVDLLAFVKQILLEGDEAGERLSTEDREELHELIAGDMNVE